jgi:hypothetical protein
MLRKEACEHQERHASHAAVKVHHRPTTPPQARTASLEKDPATNRARLLENSDSIKQDPNYELSGSPHSRSELEATVQAAPSYEKPCQATRGSEQILIQSKDTVNKQISSLLKLSHTEISYKKEKRESQVKQRKTGHMKH